MTTDTTAAAAASGQAIQTQLEPVMKRLGDLDRDVTELIARCRAAEDHADELFDQLLDLLETLVDLDVMRILEQHTPDCRRYQVDRLADQIASISRSFA
jgi:hypothetical protein